jgi:MFS family permease
MPASTSFPASVETPISWMVPVVSTVIITITFGAPYVAVMALKPIAAELGVPRSVPALTNSLAYLGTGAGGIFMGWWADRVGVKWTVPIGAVMVGGGAMLASVGGVWPLLLGHGVMIGLLGNAGVFAPLTSYVSYWFDRRRGVALSLVATGQMTAGAIWPLVFQRTIDAVGWRCPGHADSDAEIDDTVLDNGKAPTTKALDKKGGVARAVSMTPERRAEIAKVAAAKRWNK